MLDTVDPCSVHEMDNVVSSLDDLAASAGTQRHRLDQMLISSSEVGSGGELLLETNTTLGFTQAPF